MTDISDIDAEAIEPQLPSRADTGDYPVTYRSLVLYPLPSSELMARKKAKNRQGRPNGLLEAGADFQEDVGCEVVPNPPALLQSPGRSVPPFVDFGKGHALTRRDS